jgi:hypothetical protein
MENIFKEYEDHLAMFNDAANSNSYEHAVHLVGLPIKPEGYDEYVKLKDSDKETVSGTNSNSVNKINKINKIIKEKEHDTEVQPEPGINYDADGVPEYLSADDYYNGYINPVWEAKHQKKDEKKILRKDTPEGKQGFNYDADGIPEYLNADDRYNGIANPAWIKKYGK